MDPNSTPQTVAQAVQAATQQAQQAVSHASPAVQPPQTSQATTIDNLTCQWQGCGERCDSAEALYDHVCERHVGRKSTNNLNLTCQWGACRTTTVKRDHITSHIRVHVPLKPHKCDFCGKAFKRPQDLKKHVKTHADDSVIMNSPQGQNGRGLGANGLGQQNGKPPAYYSPAHDTSLSNHYPGYQASMTSSMTPNGVGHSFPQTAGNGQYAAYGSVSYPNSSAVADIQSMDTRRRAIEALNDFLGDIKRRAIDPSNYYDVGQRLHSNALPLPVGTGYNTGYNNSGYTNANNNHNFSNTASLLESFNNGTHMGGHGGPQGGLAAPTYSLPLPNARTKNDLQDIDRFLEQLQATVYEHSHHPTVAGGVQQTAMQTAYTGDHGLGGQHQTQYARASNSPPTFQHLHSGNVSTFASDTPGSMSGMSAASPGDRTPALTPSSQSSYTSGHSPMSSHSQVSFGSPVDHTYPNLPPVTGISDVDSSYLGTTSAPASGLSTDLSGHGGRLHTGGYLQKEPRQSAPDMEMMDTEEDGARTPRAGVDADRPKSKGNSALDPALRGDELMESASTPTAQSEGVDDKRQEEWVENIRVIEALRKWIGERLNSGEFDEAEAGALQDVKVSSDIDMKTVETAKMVAEQLAGEEKAANESHPIDNTDDHVNYPALPTA